MIKDFHKTAIVAGARRVSYTEMLQRIRLFARQAATAKGEKTLLFAENREGWAYALFSIWSREGIVVPVDASSSATDVAYILGDCRPRAAWTTRHLRPILEEAVRQSGVELEVCLIDDHETAPVPSGTEAAHIPYAQEDTAFIIYTSGTTGSPKGVMLSFRNVFANVRAVSEEVPIYNPERPAIILLPLHHILPLLGTLVIPILKGGGVAICPSMAGPDIMQTLCDGRVAIFVGVPRLWQTLYTGIKKKIDASPVGRMLFSLCRRVGSPAFSRVVFRSVHQKLGGHIAYFVSGGASLDREIGEGLRTLGIDVLEGYGMTETAPMISFTRPGDIVPGSVGLPLPSVECKIVDGELLAKGPNVMQGYYNRPEETAQVIDSEGFIHTGDLARFDEKGRLYITGRCKEIIVLSNGKNVQPSEIEFQLEKFAVQIKEAAVTQDGDLLRAILVPQEAWAAGRTDEELAEALKREVLAPYNRQAANYKKLFSLYVYRGDLPRTKLDKLQRFKLKELLAEDTQQRREQTAQPEPQTPEYQILKQYIQSEKGLDVRPTDHLETDLAFDSLDRVSLQGFIEQTFGTNVETDALAGYANVAALAEHVAQSKTRMEVEQTDWHTLIHGDTGHLDLPSCSLALPLLTRTLKAMFCVWNRLRIGGRQNLPLSGPFILAANHQSYADGPLLMSGVPWGQVNDCYFYATERHVQGPVRRALARRGNIILMEQSNLKNSILKLAQVLKQGKNVAIFPEGSRTRTGEVDDFYKTFAILALELNVPIIPVCIRGAYEALPRGAVFLRPCRIRVDYLPAICPKEGDTYDTLTQQVQAAITAKIQE